MPAFALTAEEIAAQIAAEQAAAAAAQQAAAMAAQQAAAEAAAQAAAQAAAEQAATQAGTQAATQAATQASTNGIQALAQEVGVGSQPTGIDQLTQAFQRAQESNIPMSQEQFLNNSFAGPGQPIDLSGTGTVGQVSPNTTLDPLTGNSYVVSQPVTPVDTVSSVSPPPEPPAPVEPPVVDTRFPTSTASTTPQSGGMQMVDAPKPYEWTPQTTAPNAGAATQPSGIEKLFNKTVDWATEHPIQAGLGAMSLYNMLNKPKPYEKPKYKSTFNASTYRPYEPTPPNPPYRAQYAHGGIADLGSYSDGGRMLKGPGDGMSDDIPATIANKQPARLANEEFVIPADVVSHLGNGSSEAGAKQLYKMMDRVRQARTGTKKQGKQIKPEKYLA